MTARDQSLQAEIAARRLAARRRASSQHALAAPRPAARWLWWLGALAAVAVGYLGLA